jgi:hypothetical protein
MNEDGTETARALLVQAQRQLDDEDAKEAARSAHMAAWSLDADVPQPPGPTEEDFARDREIRARTPAHLRRAGLRVPPLVAAPGRATSPRRTRRSRSRLRGRKPR